MNKEDKNGHRIGNDGRIVFDERCRNCDAPKEYISTFKEKIWECLIVLSTGLFLTIVTSIILNHLQCHA